jgi:hypothetical protein
MTLFMGTHQIDKEQHKTEQEILADTNLTPQPIVHQTPTTTTIATVCKMDPSHSLDLKESSKSLLNPTPKVLQAQSHTSHALGNPQ